MTHLDLTWSTHTPLRDLHVFTGEMTISATSIAAISLHARAGYMAHIKRALFAGLKSCPLQHTVEIEFQAKKKSSKPLKSLPSLHWHTQTSPLRPNQTKRGRIGSSWELWKPWSHYSPLEECICVARALLTFPCSWLWITRPVQLGFKALLFVNLMGRIWAVF